MGENLNCKIAQLPKKTEIDYYTPLSLRLYDVLEDIGVSTEVRKIMKQTATGHEILMTLVIPQLSSVYMFGSQYEGSTMFGMDSDIDVVGIPHSVPVVSSLSDCPDGFCFLLVPDKQAGYKKLQLVHEGQPLFIDDIKDLDVEYHPKLTLTTDKCNRVCLNHVFDEDLDESLGVSHRKGPALNIELIHPSLPGDIVFALRSRIWPDFAAEWLSRKRNFGWPLPDLIEKCKSLGFLIVPAIHPESEEPDKQWRVSFSHQERLLVTQFNSVQLKCYVLLKLIKKEILEGNIGDETLTSYHCKTCMFYCIENTPNAFWVPENMASCLVMCLRQLVCWVYDDNCPNYFIPSENMFDRIKDEDLKKKLMISFYCILLFIDLERVLRTIQTEEIGSRIEESTEITGSQENQMFREVYQQISKLISMKTLLDILLGARNLILKRLYCRNLELSVTNFGNEVLEIEGREKIAEYTKAETEIPVSLILPFLKLSLLSQRVVIQLGDSKDNLEKILKSKMWEDLDPVTGSSKLKQASAMLTTGHIDSSMKVLSSLPKTDKISICNCYKHIMQAEKEALMIATRDKPNITVTELITEVFQPCVIFLPNEHPVTPLALKYEMIRCLGQPCFTEGDKACYFWYDWSLVEGKFLTQFLLYSNYRALEQEHKANHTIKKMVQIINRKIPYHRETSLNLLGWVHKTRGDTATAVECFQKSLGVQPTYNAACLHLCFLICCY